MELNKIYNEDCFETFNHIPDKSVDLVLTDPPYGVTSCKWDIVPNLDRLWIELKRLGKNNCAYVFTASQPFTTDLINSNRKWFKYSLVWEKERPSNPAHAKIRFMKWHEDILVFMLNKGTFNPQMENRLDKNKRNNKLGITHKSDVYGKQSIPQGNGLINEKYPSSVLKVNVERGLHPTQKPVALMEYLIKTYSNEGDLIYDPFMGSGTTAIACKNLNRNYIGCEISKEYCEIAKSRIKDCATVAICRREYGI
uniref:Putative methyltransferase n=1 Tax=viral metagenome TaxID=1070528 RepID=A0A6M3JEY4_9ZZZZ